MSSWWSRKTGSKQSPAPSIQTNISSATSAASPSSSSRYGQSSYSSMPRSATNTPSSNSNGYLDPYGGVAWVTSGCIVLRVDLGLHFSCLALPHFDSLSCPLLIMYASPLVLDSQYILLGSSLTQARSLTKTPLPHPKIASTPHNTSIHAT